MGTVSVERAEGIERNLPYEPDYAVPPGETLEEVLDELGLSQAELARRTNRPEKTINEIIKGKAAITLGTAFQFERVTGVSARLWLNLERDYRAALVRQTEREQLRERVGWLEGFPYGTLMSRKLVRDVSDPVDRLCESLHFFGVANLEAWDNVWGDMQVAYRHSATYVGEPKALAAWLRCGEIQARQVQCAPFDRAAFLRILRAIRLLTPQRFEQIRERIGEFCASAGVALVFTRELPGTHVFGATRWLSPQKAILQLSLRFPSDDQRWFAFFHEAAHILLHGKKEKFVHASGRAGQAEAGTIDGVEAEADAWAADFLIPRRELQAFIDRGAFDSASIETFADALGIAAGIVVGQLQHHKVIR